MPLVKAQCTNCGAALDVDNQKDAAICPFCGTAYVVEKAIQQFSINSVGTIHADVLTVVNDSTDRQFLAAEACLKLGEYADAAEKYRKLTQSSPDDARSWYGLARAFSENCTVQLCSPADFAEIVQAYDHAVVMDCEIDKKIAVTNWHSYLEELRQNIQSEAERLKSVYLDAQDEVERIRKKETKSNWFPLKCVFIGFAVMIACAVGSVWIPWLQKVIMAGVAVVPILALIGYAFMNTVIHKELIGAIDGFTEVKQECADFFGYEIESPEDFDAFTGKCK